MLVDHDAVFVQRVQVANQALFGRIQILIAEDDSDLTVTVDYTVKGPQMTIQCGDVCFSYLEHDLPKKLYVGVTGCEGLNRFYHFKLTTK